MEKEFTEEEIKEIAKQLSCPSGENGIKMGDNMNENNISMTISAINAFDFSDHDTILELGHGNCGHLEMILNKANQIEYTGLDISDLMQEEAQQLNQKHVHNQTASFHLYDGETIPFENEKFDKVMTVNTLYFWQDPKKLISEIYRVLKPKGTFTLVFADKESMQKMPFTKFGFQLYTLNNYKDLLYTTEFKIETIHKFEEKVETKTGQIMERTVLAVKTSK